MATFDPRVAGRRRDPQQGRLAAARRRGRALDPTSRCSASSRRDDGVAAPSRHLGLVPAAERDEAAHALDRLAERDRRARRPRRACCELAARRARPRRRRRGTRPPRSRARPARRARSSRWPAAAPSPSATPRPRSCSRAAGCDVVTFDPLDRRSACRTGTRGLYLGGGFPEVHAAGLAANAPLRADLRGGGRGRRADRRRVRRAALPLPQRRRRPDGRRARRATAAMTPRLTLRYPTADRARRHPAHPRRRDRSPATSSTAPTSTPSAGRAPGLDRRRRSDVGFAAADPARVVPAHPLGRPPAARPAVRRRRARRCAARGAEHAVRHRRRVDRSPTRCATTATPRSAPGCSTSRSTSTPARGRRGSTRRCAPASTTSARYPDADARPRQRSPRATAGRPSEVLADRRAPPRRSRWSPGCGRGGARSSCTRSSPSRTPRSLQAGHRVTEVALPTPATASRSTRRRCPTTPTWWCSATRPTRPACCTPPPPIARAAAARAGWSSSTRRSWTPCPGEPESLAAARMPGLRRGPQPDQALGRSRACAPATCSAAPDVVAELRAEQTPWSVSTHGRGRDGRLRDRRRPRPRPSAARTTIARLARRPRGAASASSAIAHVAVVGVVRAGPTSATGVHAALRDRRDRRTPGRHLPRPRPLVGADRRPSARRDDRPARRAGRPVAAAAPMP